ncbi:Z1 domain-containing protein [Mesoplasma coleopterae]|uniref:Z1 domain-containing protein n=1 Tax=Mesoplasma coleopterae TaxID=324078 RepID=UPI000D03727C|nr:Z1 domain-containing protein [Mesoplasma coleopterae]AVN63031.1 hypothetical protein CG000_01790 [Mesoplasma coleopterae]
MANFLVKDIFKNRKKKNFRQYNIDFKYFDFYKKIRTSKSKLNSQLMEKYLSKNVEELFWEEIYLSEEQSQYGMYNGKIAYGEVQSGKTMNMIASLYKAYDLGFKYIFVLTGNLKSLHNQTFERFIKEHEEIRMELISKIDDQEFDYDITPQIEFTDIRKINLSEQETVKKISNIEKNSKMQVFFVLKEETSYKKMIEIIKNGTSSQVFDSILIMDDEADWSFADLDNEKSLHNILINFKNICFKKEKYLKYLGFTATPYKILENFRQKMITNEIVLLKTKKINSLIDSNKFEKEEPFYSGLELFHSKNLKIKEEGTKLNEVLNKKYITTIDDFLIVKKEEEKYLYRLSIFTFLINSRNFRVMREFSKEMITGLIFKDISKDEHKLVKNYIQNFLLDKVAEFNQECSWEKIIKIFELEKNNDKNILFLLNYLKTKFDKDSFGFWNFIKLWFDSNINNNFNFLRIFNSENENNIESLKEIDGFNEFIIIGGYSMSRGVTFPNLVMELILHKSNKYDSTLQRARWFGFRNYENLVNMDILMTKSVLKSFEEAIDYDKQLRERIENNVTSTLIKD